MSSTVFVSNLPFKFNEDTVKNHFYYSATIEKVVMVRNEENSSYGMAFIKVRNPKEAEKLVKKHDKTVIGDRMISVRVADEDV
ncbi:RNA-binding protein [bacterium]|nr:RNA-binding protein [bacterium]